jgi:hypothetical protein
MALRAGLAVMLLVAGCNDATDSSPGDTPPGLTGSYVLQAPVTVFEGVVQSPEGDFHLRVLATGGSLLLARDSSYEHEVRFESYIDGQLSARPRWVDRGQWRARGDTVDFDSDYIEGLVFRGVTNEGAVTVEQDLVGEGTKAGYPFRQASLE